MTTKFISFNFSGDYFPFGGTEARTQSICIKKTGYNCRWVLAWNLRGNWKNVNFFVALVIQSLIYYFFSEILHEDKLFQQNQLAALVASKVYYHLGAFEDSLTYALGAGDLFDVNARSEYVETTLGKYLHFLIFNYFVRTSVLYDVQFIWFKIIFILNFFKILDTFNYIQLLVY